MSRNLLPTLMVLGGGLALAFGQSQTPEDIWPAGVNGTKTWPREIPNSFSNESTNWRFPEGGNVPPNDLFTRIKCPTGTAKLKPTKSYSTRWETGRWHPPEYAFDDYTVSRWSTNTMNHRWLVLDFGTPKVFKQIYLLWETANALGYDLKTTDVDVLVTPPATDKDTAVVKFADPSWKTIKQVTGMPKPTGVNGRADVVAVEGEGRFLQLYATQNGSSYGYSLYEMTVCVSTAGTSLQPQAQAAKPKGWSLVMGKDGLPRGIRAFDVTGRSQGARKLPASNILVVPAR